jgi:preprotein translocase subunit SecD
MKQFDKLVCKPGPNANTVNDNWKSTLPGYSEDDSPWDNLKIQTVSCDASGTKYVLGPAVVKGTDVTSVSPELDTSSGQWIINIGLNSSGGSAFGKLTTSQYDQYFAGAQQAENQGTYSDDSALDEIGIVLDGDVQSSPETNGALTSGSFEITGPQPNGFTQAEAAQLANVLKYGALPLTFTLANETSVSPQVGHASLDAGLLAGILGLLLVVIYLFYYYRGLGIVSVSSLLIAALLAYFSVVILSKYQNFTMSLSAIAGLVVAIGITADSFIVYFERLRDEVRDGKSLRPAVEAGWKRARRTILVSDTVSFLAAVLLYHFATSDVQGFAYTLGLTTIIDVVVVFLFTKPMVTLLAGTKFFSSGSKWSGLDPERLGAKSPWRGSGARRYVRAQRPPTRRPADGGPSTSKEA